MKFINIHHAKKIAMSALAMTSCGFILWINQNNALASDSSQPSQQETRTVTTLTKQDLPTSLNVKQADSSNGADKTNTQYFDQNDQGNYGYLDKAQINDKGQLVASGWHATNASADRQYHYVIAYDQTNHTEIARQNITGTNAVINRPDVQNVHNVAGADKSGFNVTFDLSKVLANTNTVQIISRYTNDKAGNGNFIDYWYAPITINKGNYAYLDKAVAADDQLELSGWHATNEAANKPYHYIIIVDQTAGHEVARTLVKSISRTDVAKVYPDVDGADISGFSTNFELNQFNFNHQLQVISRYSSVADGNSDYVDYYFSPLTTGNYANYFFLDGINWSDKGNVSVTGWHANDVSQFETNRFLILFDTTANHQVAVTRADTVPRDDVAKVYPNIATAKAAGFNGSFNLNNVQLIGGHSYAIISRYSTSNEGNGGLGSYTDYWSNLIQFNQRASWFDQVKMTNDGLHVSGWLTSDYAADHPYPYLIILENGKEIKRTALKLTERNDIATKYSSIYNSKRSGFDQLISLNPTAITGQLQLILRFSDDPNGNGNFDDQYSRIYGSNEGWFDQVSFTGSQIQVSGWHACNQSASKPYHWIIAVDANGSELGRWQVKNTSLARPDLGKTISYILNSDHSGFNLTFNVQGNMQHKVIKLISRLTDDPNGNGNYADVWSNEVSINSGAQTNGRKTLYYDALGNVVKVFNDAEVICQNPELPTGCEMTAVTMMLRYAGVNINKFQVAAETPRSSNGNYGFVGNPYSPSGWWVFPTGIAPVVQRHLGTSQVMTGWSLQSIKDKLNVGHLVVVWMANMNGFINHAITLTGYDSNGFFYNNPWTGRKEGMSFGEFYGHWNADAQRALSY